MSALHLMIPGNLHLSYENINEPWEKRSLDGVYHHPSLLFDEDGRIYMGYGFNEVRILELNDTLTAPKEGGFERLLVEEKQDAYISYEGAHFYKKTEPIIFCYPVAEGKPDPERAALSLWRQSGWRI